MKRILWLALGVICIVALATAGTSGVKHPIEFTLVASGHSTSGDPAPMSFTLAPRSIEPGGLGVLSGSGYIEDPDFPFNTAIGYQALANNTPENVFPYKGCHNTTIGYQTLFSNTTGYLNTASGHQALYNNTEGYQNMASGTWALYLNSIGHNNTASGYDALDMNNGNWNTALGRSAGHNCLLGSYNIYLGAMVWGLNTDTNTIRIGLPYNSTAAQGQNQTFIAGIVEKPFTVADAPTVVGITSGGQLGIMSSELLPQGPTGPPGPQGPAGEGLVSGSLLFLATASSPAGYTLLGTCDFSLAVSGTHKPLKLTVYVYQKQ